MENPAFLTLFLLIAITMIGILSRRLEAVPLPIILVISGLLLSFIPGFPSINLDPGFFFVVFLPPLLFSDGWLMNLRDFKAAKRPILLLALGLVVFTTLVIGWTLHQFLNELPLSVCFALGAIVSPTDAVATSAITERLKVPHRIVTILNGESLVNDASGLVAFKFAVAAAVTGAFDLGEASLSFLFVSAGGLVIGYIMGWVVTWMRKNFLAHDPNSLHHITLSLLTPYAAFIPADHLGVSGVLSVVAAGLYCGWADPMMMSPETRSRAWHVWEMILFWFNAMVFFLLGLQLKNVLEGMNNSTFQELLILALVVGGLTIFTRILWVFPGAYIPRLFSRRIRSTEPPLPWQNVFIVSWAGMRGAVTLAGALSIPVAMADGLPFPGRNLVIFLAFAVILITLLVNGLSLPLLIRKLCIRDDGLIDIEEKNARVLTARSAIFAIEDFMKSNPVDESHAKRLIREYELRIQSHSEDPDEKKIAYHHRSMDHNLRLAAIGAERQMAIQLYNDSIINDQVLQRIQTGIDIEETRLMGR